uniref:Uncharacterized protein n=1 Tax=Alexandrium monilatum TaxID=311494 RepID=A0A7S4PVI8_9DINO
MWRQAPAEPERCRLAFPAEPCGEGITVEAFTAVAGTQLDLKAGVEHYNLTLQRTKGPPVRVCLRVRRLGVGAAAAPEHDPAEVAHGLPPPRTPILGAFRRLPASPHTRRHVKEDLASEQPRAFLDRPARPRQRISGPEAAVIRPLPHLTEALRHPQQRGNLAWSEPEMSARRTTDDLDKLAKQETTQGWQSSSESLSERLAAVAARRTNSGTRMLCLGEGPSPPLVTETPRRRVTRTRNRSGEAHLLTPSLESVRMQATSCRHGSISSEVNSVTPSGDSSRNEPGTVSRRSPSNEVGDV